MVSHSDIIILGAGPAGLACALKCQQLGREYLLIEGSNRIGGRLGSIYKDGYIFDLGFQVYNSTYVNTNRLLDLDELNLKYFKPGAAVHYGNSFQIISDPLRDISKVFSTIFSSLTTVSDNIKILALKNSLSNYKIEDDEAEDYIWGYTIMNDVTLREQLNYMLGPTPVSYTHLTLPTNREV